VIFENRSRSGMRKSGVERYRNCRVNWLLLKRRDRNWRERFGEFNVYVMLKCVLFCFWKRDY